MLYIKVLMASRHCNRMGSSRVLVDAAPAHSVADAWRYSEAYLEIRLVHMASQQNSKSHIGIDVASEVCR